MNDRAPLRLPTGARVEVGDGTLELHHDGDVVLEQTLGRRLVRLDAAGDVTLRGFTATGALLAGGTLRLEGPIDAEELRADIVEIGDVDTTARAIVATTRVTIGRAALNVDVISAPEVVVDPGATGRVRILDCLHDIPATRVRGCLSVAEYEADFGQVADFLARRGVTAISRVTGRELPAEEAPSLDPADDAAATAEVHPHVEPEAVAAPEALEPVATPAPEPAPPVEAPAPPPRRPPAAPTAVPLPHVEEEVDDAHDDPTVPPPRRAPTRAAKNMERAVQRLQEAYGDDPPPPVGELLGLVRRGRVHLLQGRIDALWTDTLRDHLRRKAPLPRAVLLAFHALREARDRA